MVAHYRETIGRVLQEFDTGVAVSDNQTPDQLYMDLAWEGLRYPNIDAWISQSQEEKDRINEIINDYIEGHNNQNCPE